MSCIMMVVVQLAFETATRVLHRIAHNKWRCMRAKFELVIHIVVKCYKEIYWIADKKPVLNFIYTLNLYSQWRLFSVREITVAFQKVMFCCWNRFSTTTPPLCVFENTLHCLLAFHCIPETRTNLWKDAIPDCVPDMCLGSFAFHLLICFLWLFIVLRTPTFHLTADNKLYTTYTQLMWL